MRRDAVSGTLLIAGAVAGLVGMLLHPSAQGLMAPQAGSGPSGLNALITALALLATPVVFMGLLGLARRVGPSELTTAALVAFGFGGVALMSAAVASGFVATGVINHIVAEEGPKLSDVFLLYTGLLNQGFGKVNVVAYSAGILLWSAAIARQGRAWLAAAVGGVLVGGTVLVAFFADRLTMDVHGVGIVAFMQSAWLLWMGILMWRREGGQMAPAA
jgi:hypothetical protein